MAGERAGDAKKPGETRRLTDAGVQGARGAGRWGVCGSEGVWGVGKEEEVPQGGVLPGACAHVEMPSLGWEQRRPQSYLGWERSQHRAAVCLLA